MRPQFARIVQKLAAAQVSGLKPDQMLAQDVEQPFRQAANQRQAHELPQVRVTCDFFVFPQPVRKRENAFFRGRDFKRSRGWCAWM